MVLACIFFSLMNACVYGIRQLDGSLPATVISFVRIVCNLLVVWIPASLSRRAGELIGDKRPSLWLRGLFGTIALMLSFTAITRIGPGESAFLAASSGVFVALLGPWVLGQSNSFLGWLAILGSFAGVGLMFQPSATPADYLGRAMALAAGFLSALAYLMVARAGRSNSPQSVIFYFCLVALMVHLAYFAVYGYRLPQGWRIWTLLLAAGLLGSAAQMAMTRAYQQAPAAMVSAVGYLAPVLSSIWAVLWFARVPDGTTLLGSALILLFGVLLPFLR